jgi:hypothetical protein
MSLKNLDELPGKRIAHVLVKEHDEPGPSAMLRIFLVFDDGDVYEFYSGKGDIQGTGVHKGSGLEGALRYGREASILQWHPEPTVLPESVRVRPHWLSTYLSGRC